MKKILSLVVALVLVLSAVSALAAGSKSSGDIPSTDTTPSLATAEVIALEIIDDTEGSAAVIQQYKDAFAAGDALSALPEGVKAKLPEGYATINEIVTARFTGDTSKAAGNYEVTINFTSPYAEGDSVYLVLAKLDGSAAEVIEAKGQNDGSLKATVTADQVKAFGNDAFILLAVSK